MDLIETQLDQPIKHWYYRHKYWAIRNEMMKRKVAPIEVMDVGAGSALFSLELQKEFPGLFVLAVDPGYSPEQVSLSNSRIRYSRTYESNNADLILLTDVLEHIPDDSRFLSEYVEKAKKESTFVITVPAFMSLWSNHDVYLKHFRRYQKDELIQLMNESDLEVVQIKYLYSLLFPLAYLRRKYFSSGNNHSDLKQDKKIVQLILNFVLFFDRFFSKKLPFGVSLVAVGVKRDSHVKEN